MNLLLVGDFINAGSRFCGEFKNLKNKKVNILFCSYAFETATEYNNAQKNAQIGKYKFVIFSPLL